MLDLAGDRVRPPDRHSDELGFSLVERDLGVAGARSQGQHGQSTCYSRFVEVVQNDRNVCLAILIALIDPELHGRLELDRRAGPAGVKSPGAAGVVRCTARPANPAAGALSPPAAPAFLFRPMPARRLRMPAIPLAAKIVVLVPWQETAPRM